MMYQVPRTVLAQLEYIITVVTVFKHKKEAQVIQLASLSQSTAPPSGSLGDSHPGRQSRQSTLSQKHWPCSVFLLIYFLKINFMYFWLLGSWLLSRGFLQL